LSRLYLQKANKQLIFLSNFKNTFHFVNIANMFYIIFIIVTRLGNKLWES
jgi:hypothetical protein